MAIKCKTDIVLGGGTTLLAKKTRLGQGAGLGKKLAHRSRPTEIGCELREVVGSCRFLRTCETYNDRVIPGPFKGKTGRGCVEQINECRKRHCKAFACKLLSEEFTTIVKTLRPSGTAAGRVD